MCKNRVICFILNSEQVRACRQGTVRKSDSDVGAKTSGSAKVGNGAPPGLAGQFTEKGLMQPALLNLKLSLKIRGGADTDHLHPDSDLGLRAGYRFQRNRLFPFLDILTRI